MGVNENKQGKEGEEGTDDEIEEPATKERKS